MKFFWFTIQIAVGTFVQKHPFSEWDHSEEVEKWGESLDVRFNVVTNVEEEDKFRFEVTLTNNGQTSIHKDFGWCLYFNQDQAIYNKEENIIGRNLTNIGNGMDGAHVNGYLWKFCPNKDWNDLKKSDELILKLKGQGFICQDSTLMPNWFIACHQRCSDVLEQVECCTPATVAATKNLTYNKPDYVAPFDSSKKWLRDSNDQLAPLSYTARYQDINEKKPKERKYGLPILPQPAYVDLAPNTNQIDNNGEEIPAGGIPIHKNQWKISYNKADHITECDDPSDLIREWQSGSNDCGSNCNDFVISTGYPTQFPEPHVDGLSWKIAFSSSISFTAYTCEGQNEGLKFIKKIIEKLQGDSEAMLFTGTIGGTDGPRFQTRGLHLDVSRNFHGVESMKKLLKIMNKLELNQLHLRLTDDEAWRMQIEALPELTEIGANRCYDPTMTHCFMPQFGSGPEKDGGTGTGSGFITKEDYRILLQLGKDQGIKIVPEIVAPSHSAAAVQAMRVRNDTEYLLTDPKQDQDDSKSVQGFYDNIINPCIQSSYNFLSVVVQEIADIHKEFRNEDDSMFHNHFHIGGDEMNTDNWKSSPACIEMYGPDQWDEIHVDFFRKYMKIVADHDFNIDGWEEVWEFERKFENGTGMGLFDVYDPQVWRENGDIKETTVLTAYHWNNMWLEYDTSSTGYMMANKGYNVLLTPATHLYLDHASDYDPNERGLMWATRYSDLWKTFSFRPMHMNSNGLYTWSGNTITSGCVDNQDGKDFTCTKLEKPENIVGIQGCMWSEELIKEEHMWTQTFPRLVAIAERGYREALWESKDTDDSWAALESEEFKDDFALFRYGLKYFNREMDFNHELPYHLPKPGVAESLQNFQNIYTYNKHKFRKQGSSKWLDYNEFKKQDNLAGKIVQVATVNYKKENFRTGLPVEFKWPGGKGSANGLLPSLLLLIWSYLLF